MLSSLLERLKQVSGVGTVGRYPFKVNPESLEEALQRIGQRNSFSEKQYDKQLSRIRESTGYIDSIKQTVEQAVNSILASDIRSFVIYGEPQSGKTEMMICLTAKLLDEGFRNIFVLVNDNVELLNQNLERFTRSNLSPSAQSIQDIRQGESGLTNATAKVIFLKKNKDDLEALLDRARHLTKRLVIDDEGDFATPNSKINRNDKSRINELVEELVSIDKGGVYVGVTATPARLDLNNLYNNDKKSWVYFRPYPDYSGAETFFPRDDDQSLKYSLIVLPDSYDIPSYLKKALCMFLVNVSHMNLIVNNGLEQNYSMIVHTSGRKDDHTEDKRVVDKFFEDLEQGPTSQRATKIYELMLDYAGQKYGRETALKLIEYVADRHPQHKIQIVNSKADKTVQKIKNVTEPIALFTVAIGGNIISRGVTFNNLLSMFFTRSAHKIQQDTYIQRARMFGNRKGYLGHFDLHIPESLYLAWHQAFRLHRLSMASIESGEPIWLESDAITSVAPSSIDRRNASITKGTIEFPLLKSLPSALAAFGAATHEGYENFEKFVALLPEDYLGYHIEQWVREAKPSGDKSLLIHSTSQLTKDSEGTDPKAITRKRGLFAGRYLEAEEFPLAVHHFKIFTNSVGNARVVYRYRSSRKTIRFIKSMRPSAL